MKSIEEGLNSIIEQTKQAAREIYYAKKNLRNGKPEWAMVNLDAALKQLGVHRPEDVDLSSNAINYIEYSEKE